ncbi:hypothetical protein [Plantactinospora sp. KLBMP9567]|nr:hypothetical protein [Plantactinospora sp. KLBMP9567]MDW5329552.1 hypothetical protein [Plantactinospora sp. KLBMP9567]
MGGHQQVLLGDLHQVGGADRRPQPAQAGQVGGGRDPGTRGPLG